MLPDSIWKIFVRSLPNKKVSQQARRLSSIIDHRHINAIAPGEVETEDIHSAGIIGSDFEKAMIASTPLGRIGQPDDIGRRPLNGN